MTSLLRAAAILAACTSLAAPVAAQQTADRIWSGGPLITMNDKALRAMAVQRESAALPNEWQRPGMLRYMQAAAHDKACATSVIDDLVAAMTAGDNRRVQ